MARRALDSRPTVRSEGGLLPPDLLDRIADPGERELPGLDPVVDYALQDHLSINESAARSWDRAKWYWGAFKAMLENARPGTELGITRQHWLIPLLKELGYADLDFRPQAETVNSREFRISHRATPDLDAPPLHLVACSQALDRVDPTSLVPKTSPHGLLQSYLNESAHFWGIVSNGLQLRILRDNASLTRPAYLEFDLKGMMEGGVFADFTLLWMVAHRSRLPKGTTDASSCFLEQWYKAALVRGARALGDLRIGVERAIQALGQGFIDHPGNETLRAKLASGELDGGGYYRQLLRMVYRLLFLLVAEERDLLFPVGVDARGQIIYFENYSVSRLREQIRLSRSDERHDDLWRVQRVTFDMLRKGEATLGLPPLGSGIFDTRMCPDLEECILLNDAAKNAVRGLSLAPTKSGYRRINYRDLDVEELGSVYESLLDEQPTLRTEGSSPQFKLAAGGERKSTGSYYTPSVLVQELIRTALDPVIQQALASARDSVGKRKALLDLAVCDPACGSGHFLLAAARRIGQELARLASGEHEPDPGVLRHSIREAMTHCVYGVDLNPLAVDLCRLALWLEGHEPGRPLGFLDHRIRCGNSLVGATTELVEKGIPTEAFQPVEGDSKEIAKEVKKRNRQELEKPQLQLFGGAALEPAGPTDEEANEAREIGTFEEDKPDDVALKEAEYREFSAKVAHKKRAADLWTAAFFWPLRKDAPAPPTQAVLLSHRAGGTVQLGSGESELARILEEVRPFHWELEFPDVFATKGGFDCVLGNPPWDRISLKEREFFADRDSDIAADSNSGDRAAKILKLKGSDPAAFSQFVAARGLALRTKHFLVNSARFPLSAVGDMNTYALFTDLFDRLVATGGRCGLITQTQLITEKTFSGFVKHLIQRKRIASSFAFENERKLFPGAHHSTRFTLLTIAPEQIDIDCATALWDVSWLVDARRRYSMSADDIRRLNPDTWSIPQFRARADAVIASKVYASIPLLGSDSQLRKGISATRVMHDKDDAGVISWDLEGSVAAGRLPLFESKLIEHYNHRYATYAGVSEASKRKGYPREVTLDELQNPAFRVLPRKWVAIGDTPRRFQDFDRGWILHSRKIANNIMARTITAAITPLNPNNGSASWIRNDAFSTSDYLVLLAILNSFVFDYFARQKVAGININSYHLFQLPVPTLPSEGNSRFHKPIILRAFELSYTAHDLDSLGADFAKELSIPPRPPFVWDENRREALRCEVDALVACAYGLHRDELDWILDAQPPSESFRVLRDAEISRFGEFRTKRLILEYFERVIGGRELG